ncbi:MAG: hypothetical protein QM227_05970 [Bacillota bacterium]|nr:hypothetical protein [Bacillota bacterium]
MNNYRNNMPHYDSLPHDYNPMGLNERKYSNDKKLYFTNSSPTMPQMPGSMFQTPFIPDSEMPFELDGDMPALPRMPDSQMPGMPGLIPPWMLPEMQPSLPMMPGMPQTQMPMMPGMPQTQMPMMPEMPQTQMPMMPGMPQTQMPMTPEMPQTQMPSMPGMPPADGNQYPMMPDMQLPGMIPITCEQLRDLMRRMNCPVNGSLQPPENETVSPMEEDM